MLRISRQDLYLKPIRYWSLAGLEAINSPSSETEKSQRETIIELVSEFLASLDDQALGQLYLVFIELSNDPALIGTLLAKIHEPTETTRAK